MRELTEVISTTGRSIRDKGLIRTYQSIISIWEDLIFEHKYNLKTSEWIDIDKLDISAKYKILSQGYGPTRVRHFKKLMNRIELPMDSVFIDFGCGKGRVLFLAALTNKFNRIIGVELSRMLFEITMENLRVFKRKIKIDFIFEVYNINALNYEFNNDENVIYFYRPFDNMIMDGILKKILLSFRKNPRNIWIVINNYTQYDELFEKHNMLQDAIKYSYGGNEFAIYKIEK